MLKIKSIKNRIIKPSNKWLKNEFILENNIDLNTYNYPDKKINFKGAELILNKIIKIILKYIGKINNINFTNSYLNVKHISNNKLNEPNFLYDITGNIKINIKSTNKIHKKTIRRLIYYIDLLNEKYQYRTIININNLKIHNTEI